MLLTFRLPQLKEVHAPYSNMLAQNICGTNRDDCKLAVQLWKGLIQWLLCALNLNCECIDSFIFPIRRKYHAPGNTNKINMYMNLVCNQTLDNTRV